MKITNVTLTVIKVPLLEAIPMSLGKLTHRATGIVQVQTDEGLTGYGETWLNFPPWADKERKATIQEGIKPLVMGEDPLAISFLWEKLYKALSGMGRQWGSLGSILQAMSGFDLALWDLAGKYYRVPVYKLLGGKNKKTPVYASSLGNNVGETAKKWIGKGYDKIKLKVGFGMDADIQNLRTVREAIGPHVQLVVDANQAWSLFTAQKMLAHLEEAQVAWIEEPLRADNLVGMAELAQKTHIPIAAGENLLGRYAAADLLASHSAQIIQPDVTKCGGLSEAIKICHMAEAWEKPYAPHVFGGIIGVVASLHLAASLPGCLVIEIDETGNMLQTHLPKTPLQVQNGYLAPSDLPGWGVELNEDFVAEYAL